MATITAKATPCIYTALRSHCLSAVSDITSYMRAMEVVEEGGKE